VTLATFGTADLSVGKNKESATVLAPNGVHTVVTRNVSGNIYYG
jgi:hypothetical protein